MLPKVVEVVQSEAVADDEQEHNQLDESNNDVVENEPEKDEEWSIVDAGAAAENKEDTGVEFQT